MSSNATAAKKILGTGGGHISNQFSFKTSSLEYISNTLSSKPGLKALLVDEETRNALSVSYSQHDLLQHEVVLVDLITKMDLAPMPFLKCVCICRPTPSNINDVSNILMSHHFSEYHLVFTNLLEITQLEALVNAEPPTPDGESLIKSVEEIYLDTTPVTDDVTIVPLSSSAFTAAPSLIAEGGAVTTPPPMRNPLRTSQWDPSGVHRVCQGITSMMLTMKRRPVIRYRGGSKICQKIGEELGSKAQNLNAQFPDLRSSDSVVLILDRCDDPITPLLTQWTYEAMIHELIGIVEGNKVVVDAEAASSDKELDRTHLLDPTHDGFFGKNRYNDFGELCMNVKELVETYKSLNNIDRTTASLDEIKNFVSRMSDAKHESTIMTRHCSIMAMLSDTVKRRNLADLSVVEQDMISSSAINDHSKQVYNLVADPSTDILDALRLTMIYALRYEKVRGTDNYTERLKKVLEKRGLPDSKIAQIDRLCEYGGFRTRTGDIFHITHSIGKVMSKLIPGFAEDDGVTNVLTQHTPWMKKLINRVYNGILSEQEYPYAGPVTSGPNVCKNIIVFVVGGVTYEEAMLINNINSGTVENKPPSKERLSKFQSMMTGGGQSEGSTGGGGSGGGSGGMGDRPEPTATIEAKVVLGSTAMLNSKTFIDAL